MTTVAIGLDPIFKKFPTISGETQKIGAALAAVESGARLTSGFLPYALASQNLLASSARLRTAHKDLDAALQTLSSRVQAAYAKIAPSEFLAALRADDAKAIHNILKVSDLHNKKLSNGEMPLHYAIRMGSSETVKYLLNNARVNPLAKDHQGLTAFEHAFIKNDSKMIALLMGTALGTKIPESALTAKPDFAELQQINQEIAGLRRPPVSKLPPLHAAAVMNDLAGLEKLAKTDLNGVDASGMTALHYAVALGREAVIQWLLAKGANLEAKASNGMNLLHFATISGSDALLKRFLDTKKFDLNAADGRGRTPLHFAIAGEKLSTAKMLIERGGDPLANTMKTTPFGILEGVSRIRAEFRDPLKLESSALYTLGAFAISAIWFHYLGDAAKAEAFCKYISPGDANLHFYGSKILPIFASAFAALPVLTPLYKTMKWGDSLWKSFPARIAFSSALGGYLLDSRPTKSLFEGGNTLFLGKTLVDALHISWNNSALETYRPVRNALVHTANTLFAAYAFLYTSGIKKNLVCQYGTKEQCIFQSDLKPKYEQPPECQGLENGVTQKLLDTECEVLNQRQQKIDDCLAEDVSPLEIKIKGICESRIPTEDKISCMGLPYDQCTQKKNAAYEALQKCKQQEKSDACLNYFPKEDKETCESRLKNEDLLKKEACEARFPLPLEDAATCKARVKPLFEARAAQCRVKVDETLADAHKILDLSGDSNPEEALKKLMQEFQGNPPILDKIKLAYDTIKHPPPYYTLSPADDPTAKQAAARLTLGLKEGHTEKDCIKAYRKISIKCHPDKIKLKPELQSQCPEWPTISAAKDLLCP